jgi:hypothetical protein
MGPKLPPIEFLLESSSISLQDLELASLSRASNLGKAIKEEMFMWAEQYAAAMLARWMMDNREKLLATRDIRVKPLDGFEYLRGEKSA